MKTIRDKEIQYVKELNWKLKELDYTNNNEIRACIHETIDEDIYHIPIAEIKNLSNEIGTSKMLEMKENYVNDFGKIEENNKLRILLYWYFTKQIYNNKIIEDIKHLQKTSNKEEDSAKP